MSDATSLSGLPTVVTLIIALSVATERVVEIVKGWWPWVDQAKDLAQEESRRRAVLQLLAVAGGIGISFLAWPISSQVVPADASVGRIPTILALGLLSSGGSGFWNTILGYASSLKDLKEADADRAKQAATAAEPRRPTEGVLRA